jgi:hypothetical protein
MRKTCVSTTTPAAIPKAVPSTTFAVLRAAPGTVKQVLHIARNLAPEIVEDSFGGADHALGFVIEEPGGANIVGQFRLAHIGEGFDGRILAE